MTEKIMVLISILLVSTIFFTGCMDQGSGDTSEDTSKDTNTYQETKNQERQTLQGGWETPTDESINACSGKTEGSSCQFNLNQETITGTCRNMASGQMVCSSDRMRQGPGGNRTGFMVEAIEACSGKLEGEVCTFKINERIIEGTCTSRMNQTSCTPNNGGNSQRPMRQ